MITPPLPLGVLTSLLIGLAAVPGLTGPTRPVGVWPLEPRPAVVRTFDPPDVPWGRGHRGVDLAGRAGAPVRTALAGRVAFSGRLAGRGVVVVEHGTSRTTYEPVAGSVPVGTRVAAGSAIGVLERVGSHCAPRVCLHWGWRRGTTYLDPLRLVRPARVRLLPSLRQASPPRIRPAGAPARRPAAAAPW